jgi:hypothetical protein
VTFLAEAVNLEKNQETEFGNNSDVEIFYLGGESFRTRKWLAN